MILRKVKGKLKCNERHCTHSAKYELVANEGLHGIPLCVKHLQVLDYMLQEVIAREVQGVHVQSAYNVGVPPVQAPEQQSKSQQKNGKRVSVCKAENLK